jgi:hypothetical protein
MRGDSANGGLFEQLADAIVDESVVDGTLGRMS